jgi:hypothetical protein
MWRRKRLWVWVWDELLFYCSETVERRQSSWIMNAICHL